QLRSTVSQFGATGEPTRQILDYLWNSYILLPSDCRSCSGTTKDDECQFQSASQLQPVTSGSLGLDLAAAVDFTIMTTSPQLIPTGIYGPLLINGVAMGALLLGRSSTTLSGVFVLPGLVDADYSGEIKIMIYTPFPPVKICKGQRLAQLVPLLQLTKTIAPLSDQKKTNRGFGSTGNEALLTLNLSSRPKLKVTIYWDRQSHALLALLDTGADSSIISPEHWPARWPLYPSNATITGVGGISLAKRT
ncbi:POK9 protein, partial [Tachuris rubrigastra]|nr:POK9 protein [Tachuris rubrigastra]